MQDVGGGGFPPLSFLNADSWMKCTFPAFRFQSSSSPAEGKLAWGRWRTARLQCNLKMLCTPKAPYLSSRAGAEGALLRQGAYRGRSKASPIFSLRARLPSRGPPPPLSPAAFPHPPASLLILTGSVRRAFALSLSLAFSLPPLRLASPQSATRGSALPHSPLGHRLGSGGAGAPIYKMARGDVIAAEAEAPRGRSLSGGKTRRLKRNASSRRYPNRAGKSRKLQGQMSGLLVITGQSANRSFLRMTSFYSVAQPE